MLLNPFYATDPFWYPLKTSENQTFSDVFRGYQKRSVAWNGLKNILTENIKDAIFTRPKSRWQSEILETHVEAMDAYCNTPDDYNIIFKTASAIRKGIIDKRTWAFTRLIIIGPKSIFNLASLKK